MMKTRYKLMKTTTKIEKIEKSLYPKLYNIINLKTNRYKESSSGKIIQSILTSKLMRPVSILRLPKE